MNQTVFNNSYLPSTKTRIYVRRTTQWTLSQGSLCYSEYLP